MNSTERAGAIVHAALERAGVDLQSLDDDESVWKVLERAKPTTSVFRLELRRQKLLGRIVDAVVNGQTMSKEDREDRGYGLVGGSTVAALIAKTAQLIEGIENPS